MTKLKEQLYKMANYGAFSIADKETLIDVLIEQQAALEFECGNRCAQQNPCNAREALAATAEKLKALGCES